jgi:N-acetylmuramoyl-L-alanine amidase
MIILDNGHSGLVNGKYLTPGKRGYQPKLASLIDEILGYDSNGWFYEGVYNRLIVNTLSKMLDENNIDNHILVPENYDVSLTERINRDKVLAKKYENTFLLSIHCDAFENPSANGFTVFHYSQPKLAQKLNMIYANNNRLIRNRGTKQANFAMIKRTHSPALLLECGFMTNKNDCEYLLRNVNNISNSIFKFITTIK